MTAPTDLEIQKLLQELEKDTTNLDVLNSLAIEYFENYNLKTDKEDYDFFERAYNLKKTVKSTHNFAWFLYFEWSEIEWRWDQDNAINRAIQIQNECLELNPKSYYPYYQYGFMLLNQKKFEEAILFLDKAYQIESRRDILHNIGYCYFQLEQFEKSKDCFSRSVTDLDIENLSQYNLAICEWKLNNFEQVKFIADKLSRDNKTIKHETISGYEIGLLYFLLDDYSESSKCLIKQGISGIDLFDWTDLSYSLFKTNYELWKKEINDQINKRKNWCYELESNNENWNEYSKEEKKELLKEYQVEINSRFETLSNGMMKPILDLRKSVWVEHCGCLLFDCKRHQSKKND